MNKFFAAFIALILFINIDAQEKKILTIEEAIRLGFQHNSNIKNSKFRMETSKSSLLSARSDLYPTITGNASWDWSRTDFKVGDNSLSNESRSWGLGVSSRYNVFDGYSKYLNIGMKTRDIEAARLNLRRIHQEIVYRTITQYYRILNFTEILKVRKENLDWNIENQKIIQAKVDVGSGIMTDVRQQEVKVGQAELALVHRAAAASPAVRSGLRFRLFAAAFRAELAGGDSAATALPAVGGRSLLLGCCGLLPHGEQALGVHAVCTSCHAHAHKAGHGTGSVPGGGLHGVDLTAHQTGSGGGGIGGHGVFF
nr:TolC family protein [Ignavibacteriaceae bacterium]